MYKHSLKRHLRESEVLYKIVDDADGKYEPRVVAYIDDNGLPVWDDYDSDEVLKVTRAEGIEILKQIRKDSDSYDDWAYIELVEDESGGNYELAKDILGDEEGVTTLRDFIPVTGDVESKVVRAFGDEYFDSETAVMFDGYKHFNSHYYKNLFKELGGQAWDDDTYIPSQLQINTSHVIDFDLGNDDPDFNNVSVNVYVLGIDIDEFECEDLVLSFYGDDTPITVEEFFEKTNLSEDDFLKALDDYLRHVVELAEHEVSMF